jgi:branched-subunit amino acid transport protein AzlD
MELASAHKIEKYSGKLLPPSIMNLLQIVISVDIKFVKHNLKILAAAIFVQYFILKF